MNAGNSENPPVFQAYLAAAPGTAVGRYGIRLCLSMKTCRTIVAFAILLSMAGLFGCQSHNPITQPANQWERDGYYRPRTPYFIPKPILAFDSQPLREPALARGVDDASRSLAWYDVRNDFGPSAVSGYFSPQREVTYTNIYDRQYQHNGRVHDHYSNTTRRHTVQEKVR